MKLLDGARTRLRLLFSRHAAEARMEREFAFHLDMHTDMLVREQGLARDEARRRALAAFGGIEKHKEALRDGRGLRWLDTLSLDARLGARMLVKYRGLTFVGGFAMAVAIAIGATFFEVLTEVLNPALPFEGGDRVVALKYESTQTGSTQRRVLREFVGWRQEVRSIELLSAFRTIQLNLVGAVTAPEPVKLAEMSASGFSLAGTSAAMGRPLLPADEAPSAAPVVVIAHRAWQSKFAADPLVVGRPVSLGGTPHTIVGVMPEGFAFPVDHQFWIPLRANAVDQAPLAGPEIFVFGRLAAGTSMQQAQAELTAIAQRIAAAEPDTHGRLRPVVVPYTYEHLDLSSPAMVLMLRVAQLLVGALTLVVAVNLTILMYARTLTRLGEIAVRSALGAGRTRILVQLFVEALSLTLVGAVVGLGLAQAALGAIQWGAVKNGSVPFWISFDLSIPTVIYAMALSVAAALIMGVLPGVKATSRSLTASLHELGGRTGTRLGPVWNALVVAQVAVATAVLPGTVFLAWRVVGMHAAGPGFPAGRFLIAIAAWSNDQLADRPRIAARQRELMSRLRSEPGVAAVTFAGGVPGFAGSDGDLTFESGTTLPGLDSPEVSVVDVALDTFATYDAEILAGRSFDGGDLGAARAVIVNETLARKYFSNGRALGVRFRYAGADEKSQPSPPYEIIGVVRDFPTFSASLTLAGEPIVYHPVAPGEIHPIALSVRFHDRIPAGFPERVRAIAAGIDPSLQLRRVVPLSSYYDDLRAFWRYLAWAAGLVTASVLLLSAAGIYALLSFTVAQRTREIGVRLALGAPPRRLLLGVFGRAARQLTAGLVIGSVLSGLVFVALGLSIGPATLLLLGVVGLMLVVGLLSALGPSRRGLRIEASEALRAET